jgi:hypothetical protein
MGNDHKPPETLIDRLKAMWDKISLDQKAPRDQSSTADGADPSTKEKRQLLRFSTNPKPDPKTKAEEEAKRLVQDVRGILGNGKKPDKEEPPTPKPPI